MRRASAVTLSVAAVLLITALVRAFPKPSPYPISWELKFDYADPQRIIVTPPGGKVAEAFWYVTYTVTNLSKDEQKFLPLFEILTDDGRVLRSDNQIPPAVIASIRAREKKPQLETVNQIAGTVRIGEDQARDGVAVWREPTPSMGTFSIFVGGLSGEATILKDDQGKTIEKTGPDGQKTPIVLWRTLQLQYRILGDAKYPANDKVEFVDKQWVMR